MPPRPRKALASPLARMQPPCWAATPVEPKRPWMRVSLTLSDAGGRLRAPNSLSASGNSADVRLKVPPAARTSRKAIPRLPRNTES